MSLLVYAYTLVKPDHYPARIYSSDTSELVYNLTKAAAGSDAASSIRLCSALLQSNSGTRHSANPGYKFQPGYPEGGVDQRGDNGRKGAHDGKGGNDGGRRLQQDGGGFSPQHRISNGGSSSSSSSDSSSSGGDNASYNTGLPKSAHPETVPPVNRTNHSVSGSNSTTTGSGSMSLTPEAHTAGSVTGAVAGSSDVSTAKDSRSGSGVGNVPRVDDGGLLAAALREASVSAAALQVGQQPFNSTAWEQLANTRTCFI